MPENPELKLASAFLQTTGENVFLTGKAGTGKTTFLHNLKKTASKRMVVLAPTGVAAINAGGVTIHSFFQMPFGPRIPGSWFEPAVVLPSLNKKSGDRLHHFSREKLNIIRSLDLLVIDEISMVRADLLDGIDEVLRRYRDRGKPFGGVQLLMIGDLAQLAPVVKDDDWEILRSYYETPFFFGSRALKQSRYATIELKQVYRQTDQAFIDLLNKVRSNDTNPETIAALNKRYKPMFRSGPEGGIILTTHNYQAQAINDERMRDLAGKPQTFAAQIEGDFPEYAYPTDLNLLLKKDAQVMFVKNDTAPDKRYFNGKIGKIEEIGTGVVYVKCPGENSAIAVTRDTWTNMKYKLDPETTQIEETVTGSFTQYPLKAAWAITIHKSQGLTFDKVVIDAGAAFAHGQVYVALSRCRTLEGLVLTSALSPRVLISNDSVTNFSRNASENQPGDMQLAQARMAYQQSLLMELFSFVLLQRQASYCLKLIDENKGSLPSGLIDQFGKMCAGLRDEVVAVAEKFNSQINAYLLQNADGEHNEPLQERVKKAVVYFAEKIEALMATAMQAGEADIDNKEIRKSLQDALRRLDEEREKKMGCLNVCRDGFSIQAYLEARVRAVIEKPVAKKARSESEEHFGGENPELYKKLKSWRTEKALSMNAAQYMIIPYKTMAEIAARLPSSQTELKAIKGIGKRKLKSFATELLEIVGSYCAEKGTAIQINAESVPEEHSKLPKQNTRQVTLELVRSGKSISEIAVHRKLTTNTIEGHLARFIGTGELNIDEFVSPAKISRIADYFSLHDTRELTSAKAYFGNEISYGELQMVVAHLRCGDKTHVFNL